ncbi:MAG: hypothetical protein JJ879_00950 [Sneathiella sp.]|nr:hypothetical protein [Sneathiella sp.]
MSAEDAFAANYQTQDGYEGTALCGAVDLRTGRLLDPCGFTSATKIGNARKECPSGSFFDIGTWSCFSCPSGFNRTGFHIQSDKACSREIAPPKFVPAIEQGNQQSCDGGSFHDPRNGGECWKCPDGYGRTGAAVNEWNACGMVFKSARSAEFIKSVCPQGTFPDPNGKCYSCPEDGIRTWEAASHSRACMINEQQEPAVQEAALTCKAGEHFDFVDGGTCWTCPEGSVRSLSSVKSGNACEYLTMRWESKPRTSNGLFGIPGAAEIVADVILNRDLIDATIQNYMKEAKITDENFPEEAWQKIWSKPEESTPLNSAVYQHVYNLILKGPKQPYERAFLEYFATYIQQSRKLSSQEMKNAWESWKRGVEARTSMNTTPNNLVNIFNIGYRPPDMPSLVGGVMHLGPSATVIATYAGIALLEGKSVAFANASGTLAKGILPYRFAADIVRGTTKIADGLARTGANAASAGGVGLSSVAGPFVILTVAAIITSIATDIAMDQEKQEAIVNDALEVAKRPIILSRMASYDDGRNEMLGNWALMTQEMISPNSSYWAGLKNRVLFNDKPISGSRWVDFNQTAQGIAIGSDQSVYILKNMPMPTGFQLARFDTLTNSFVNVGVVGATKIAVAGDVLWGIDKNKRVFYFANNRANVVNAPPAMDIGAADQFVWILDTQGALHRFENGRWIKESGQGTSIDVDRMGRPWVTNSKREIWTKNNNGQWFKLYGEGFDVAAFEENRGSVVGSDGIAYRFNPDAKRWEPLGRNTDTQFLAMNYSQIWRITKNGKVSKWQ